MRLSIVVGLALLLSACAGGNEAPAGVIATPAPIQAQLAIPEIPTVVPAAPPNLSALPPAGVLRLAPFGYVDGAIRPLSAPQDIPNSGPGDIQPTIAIFKGTCEGDTARLCVLVDQFHSSGGTLLAAGHYAQVNGMGGGAPVVPTAWAVVDAGLQIVAQGDGAACPPRAALSTCLVWDGAQLGYQGSGFVLLGGQE